MFHRLRRPILVFIACSLLLHFIAALMVNYVEIRPHQPAKEVVEISYQEPKTESAKQAVPEDQKQIVDQDQRLNDETDENAKFLSAFNQRVEKQTRAIQTGKFVNRAAPGAPQPPAQKKGNELQGENKRPNTARGDLPTLAALKPQFNPTPNVAVPTPNSPTGQVSATDDYLKDVESGLQTMLSTREFVYYSYYSRIKEKIRQHWEPNIRERVKMIFRQGRTIASTKDHVTQVVITLDRNGALVKVDIVTPSGLEALDQAAVDAFRAAAPFPNPPKGMVEDDGTIKIRWDFVLEASSFQPTKSFSNFAKAKDDETDNSSGL